MLPATRAYPYTVNTQVYTGRGLWFGYSIRNVHDTAPTLLTFYDGLGTGGVIIGVDEVPAGTAKVEFPSGAAVRTESGLFVGLSGGTPTVVPYYLTQTRLIEGLALIDDPDRNLDELALARLMAWVENLPAGLTEPAAT